MNPFNLYGPQFLGFYLLLTAGTLMIMGLVRRIIDRADDVDARVTDPYLIALLRGGAKEMVRVVIVSLIDRNLIEIAKSGARTTDIGKNTRARRPIENLILQHCRTPQLLSTLANEQAFASECQAQEVELQRMGLLPTGSQRAARMTLFFIGANLLALTSLTKIVIALSRGRANIAFLVILTVIALWLITRAAFPRQTTKGQKKLAELQNVFTALKLRAGELKPGGATSELAMVTAVFGATAVSQDAHPFLSILYPQPVSSSVSSSDSSSSSSCSSCGSGCGGGCGGGGCGGCGS
jgi:uncharacterized protein (TIGR04222 family)